MAFFSPRVASQASNQYGVHIRFGRALPMNRLLTRLTCLALCLAPLLAIQAQTADLDIAGNVITAATDSIAIDPNGDQRDIARRSAIYTGESIQSSSTGSVQVRMKDTALISLNCNSTLKIENYVYEHSQSDQVILSLLEGSLRTITGDVGEYNSTQYRLNVSGAWVNTRNADFEVHLQKNGVIYFAAFNGSITVSNSLGSLTLGQGGNSDFAKVDLNGPPTPIQLYPAQLNPLNITTTPTAQASSNCH